MTTHNRFKMVVSVMLICFACITLHAEDAPSFDGDWRGYVKITDKGEMRIRIVIKGDDFTQYFKDGEGWEAVDTAESYFAQFKDFAMLGWLNGGVLWSENQMFSLSYINSGKLAVVWTRHVTNREGAEDGEAWNLRGEGELIRVD